jgi:hypothetical protein
MAQFPDVHSFAGAQRVFAGLHIRRGSDLRVKYLKPRPNRVDDLTKSAFLNRPDLHVETEGEFKGWRTF